MLTARLQELEAECCKDLEHVSFPEYSAVRGGGGLADIRLGGKEKEGEEEEEERADTPAQERADTPAQDDTSIILEVLENLHIETAGGGGKSPGKVANLLDSSSSVVGRFFFS